MIYDDVELGEEGRCSSLDNGWSSSEFESYDEASDGEGCLDNGAPDAFMRGRQPQRKTHVCFIHTFPVYNRKTIRLYRYSYIYKTNN